MPGGFAVHLPAGKYTYKFYENCTHRGRDNARTVKHNIEFTKEGKLIHEEKITMAKNRRKKKSSLKRTF